MQTRYAVIIQPFFALVPVFFTRSKAIQYCIHTRNTTLSLYPSDLGYTKVGSHFSQDIHSIVNHKGVTIYSAEIIKQYYDDKRQDWINA